MSHHCPYRKNCAMTVYSCRQSCILTCRKKGERDPDNVDEWAQLMEEDGEPEGWQEQHQVLYNSGDEWDDRLQQERHGEEDYEEWTWDRQAQCSAHHV